MTTPQTPCPGVKGHGYKNVPGAWYDITARISAARAVIYWINESLPSLDELPDSKRDQLNRAVGLAVAAENLLELCKRDADRLELELKSA